MVVLVTVLLRVTLVELVVLVLVTVLVKVVELVTLLVADVDVKVTDELDVVVCDVKLVLLEVKLKIRKSWCKSDSLCLSWSHL